VRLGRILGLVCMIAPWPFFWLGIPCASAFSNMCFRTTCVGFAGFMLLGNSAKTRDLQNMVRAIALMWNIISSWIVSAYWCTGVVGWSALVVLELIFVVVATVAFSLEGKWWKLAVTVVGDAVAYYGKHQGWVCELEVVLIRRLSAAQAPAEGEEVAPGQNATAVEEVEEDENQTWAIILMALVLMLVINMALLMGCQRRPGNQVTAIRGDSDATTPSASVDGGAGNGVGGAVPEPQVAREVDDATMAEAQALLPGTTSSTVIGKRVEAFEAAGHRAAGAMAGSTSERMNPESSSASGVERPLGHLSLTQASPTSPNQTSVPDLRTPSTTNTTEQFHRGISSGSLTTSLTSMMSDASWLVQD